MSRTAWISVSVVTLVVAIAALILVLVPAPAEAPQTSEPFSSENVKVSSPLPSASVPQAFTVSGYARGTWFFEASFPIEIRDGGGAPVGQGIAQAEGEWMTQDFVPFSANITVAGYSGPATLVLIKDNPSGLPEHDASVSFPITIQ